MCVKDVRDNVILSVREFPTCNYIFTVSTTFLCKHPQFKPPVSRNDRRVARHAGRCRGRCSPAPGRQAQRIRPAVVAPLRSHCTTALLATTGDAPGLAHCRSCP